MKYPPQPRPNQGEFPAKCNMGMVALEKVESPEDVEALHSFIQQHQEHTGSTTAQTLLDDFGTEVTKFVKVCVALFLCGWLVFSLGVAHSCLESIFYPLRE